jgi:tetratricopeptide (TPR) repeat protein
MGRLGSVEALLGRYEDGRRHIEQGLALAREIDSRWGIGINLFFLGLLALGEERCVEAQQHLEECATVFRAYGDRSVTGFPLGPLGVTASKLGQLAEARDHLCGALRISAEIRDSLTIRTALPSAALLLADLGKVERAVEIYALASRFPNVANSRLWEDIAGKHIAAAAAALPPEVAAAAEERGRARDLWATVEELLAELGGP